MPTTRNRWQQEIDLSPEPAIDSSQANQANTEKRRQTSPQRPSVSPAPELADELQDDPNPRSPKRRRVSFDDIKEPPPDIPRTLVSGQPPPAAGSHVQQATHTAPSSANGDVQRPITSSASTRTPSTAAGPASVPPVPTLSGQSHPNAPGLFTSAGPSTAPGLAHSASAVGSISNTTPMQQRSTSTSISTPAAPTKQQAAAVMQPPPQGAAPAAPSIAPSGTSSAAAAPAPLSTAPPVAPPPVPQGPPPSTPRGPPPPPVEVIKRRLDNLSKLGDLADQILSLLSKMPVLDALALDADLRLLSSGQQPSSPAPAEYQRLRALFDPVRNLYVTGFPFLISDHLAMREAQQAAMIRKANQAMFCSAIYAGGIGQLALDQAFLDIFVPENGQLLKAQSNIWLELKTQGFMTAMRLKAAPPHQVMSDLFPAGIEGRILARHPVSRTLAASEQDFALRYEARRKILFDHISRNALPELDQKFTYVELAKEVANFLIKTYGLGGDPSSLETPGSVSPRTNESRTQLGRPLPATGPAGLPMPQLPASIDSLPSFDSEDFVELAARAAAIAMRGTVSPSLDAPTLAGSKPVSQVEASQQIKIQPDQPQNGAPIKSLPLEPSSTIPHASQTAPTHVLYQRARLAEPTKSATPGTPRTDVEASYQRRTWSEEEEKALMDGLDRVQGPHWANIMALHGPGGSISEALKDRNQVQLKDKARNLKLVFLKNKIEVPYYLSQVTGTLESRAPGQAEKLESDSVEQGSREGNMGEILDQGGAAQRLDDPMEGLKMEVAPKIEGTDATAPAPQTDDIEAMLAKAAAEAVGPEQ